MRHASGRSTIAFSMGFIEFLEASDLSSLIFYFYFYFYYLATKKNIAEAGFTVSLRLVIFLLVIDHIFLYFI
ncbi:hypothetical protein F4820DRAFT_440395 [Hypoxylon rubiginosum]|uniref:Uncharacterized protein n=1 Tax=Hypoxylon rubiginosum TaxID=110542 RepID=A0ACB9YIK1_9PEZI|nr:hypothetical protein F4820DRAFT_440395 [Hypoxylon rubiginosum]